ARWTWRRGGGGAPRLVEPGRVTGSEAVGIFATASGATCCYWLFGRADPETYLAAAAAGTIDRDIPSNHSPRFAPVIEPTLSVGVEALVAAAREWLNC
ncbi:hypothetical protein ACFWPB_00235, partial [Rhodococcus sp. NPDC058514]